MVQSFSDISSSALQVPFGSRDWKSLEELATNAHDRDLISAASGQAVAGADAPVSQREANIQTYLQLRDVMSVVVQAVRDGKLSELLQPATSVLRRRGQNYKHANPFSLIGEVAWQWSHAQAIDNGIILQYATRKMVKPRLLVKFIRRHRGIQSCLNVARAYLAKHPAKDRDGMGPVSRLTVALPEGFDARSLIQAGDEILVLVKPKARGSTARLVTNDPLSMKIVERLADKRKEHQG